MRLARSLFLTIGSSDSQSDISGCPAKLPHKIFYLTKKLPVFAKPVHYFRYIKVQSTQPCCIWKKMMGQMENKI